MERKIIAMLMLTGMLGAFAPFSPMPRAAAQVSNQGTIAYGPTVQGEVTQKFSAKDDYYLIAVNGRPYEVPLDFYYRVNVGMVVKFDGTNWTIISGGI